MNNVGVKRCHVPRPLSPPWFSCACPSEQNLKPLTPWESQPCWTFWNNHAMDDERLSNKFSSARSDVLTYVDVCGNGGLNPLSGGWYGAANWVEAGVSDCKWHQSCCPYHETYNNIWSCNDVTIWNPNNSMSCSAQTQYQITATRLEGVPVNRLVLVPKNDVSC